MWICRTDKCLHIGRWTDRNWVKSATGCYNIIHSSLCVVVCINSPMFRRKVLPTSSASEIKPSKRSEPCTRRIGSHIGPEGTLITLLLLLPLVSCGHLFRPVCQSGFPHVSWSAWFLMVACLAYSLTLKMEAVCPSQMFIPLGTWSLALMYWQFHVPCVLQELGPVLVSFPLFKLSVNRREWSASLPDHFTFRDVAGGWLGPRAYLDIMEKREISAPAGNQTPTPNSSIPLPGHCIVFYCQGTTTQSRHKHATPLQSPLYAPSGLSPSGARTLWLEALVISIVPTHAKRNVTDPCPTQLVTDVIHLL
jgi:hypothetical protein